MPRVTHVELAVAQQLAVHLDVVAVERLHHLFAAFGVRVDAEQRGAAGVGQQRREGGAFDRRGAVAPRPGADRHAAVQIGEDASAGGGQRRFVAVERAGARRPVEAEFGGRVDVGGELADVERLLVGAQRGPLFGRERGGAAAFFAARELADGDDHRLVPRLFDPGGRLRERRGGDRRVAGRGDQLVERDALASQLGLPAEERRFAAARAEQQHLHVDALGRRRGGGRRREQQAAERQDEDDEAGLARSATLPRACESVTAHPVS